MWANGNTNGRDAESSYASEAVNNEIEAAVTEDMESQVGCRCLWRVEYGTISRSPKYACPY
jgi:hypothetical protein